MAFYGVFVPRLSHPVCCTCPLSLVLLSPVRSDVSRRFCAVERRVSVCRRRAVWVSEGSLQWFQ